jgi:hypothetical protein
MGEIDCLACASARPLSAAATDTITSGKKNFLVRVPGMILLVFKSSIFGFQLTVSQLQDVLVVAIDFLVVRDGFVIDDLTFLGFVPNV